MTRQFIAQFLGTAAHGPADASRLAVLTGRERKYRVQAVVLGYDSGLIGPGPLRAVARGVGSMMCDVATN